MRGLSFVGPGWLLEEEEDGKKHEENAGGGNTEYVFNAEILWTQEATKGPSAPPIFTSV